MSAYPIQALPAWANINDVDFFDVGVHELPDKGLGLIAERMLQRTKDTFDTPILLRVPGKLVLSADTVELYAKVDGNFRQLLDAAGHKSTRGDILLYLITHLVLSTRGHSARGGGLVHTAWTEYIKYLPRQVDVPTMWNIRELEMLHGTSLETALSAKIASLHKEFDELLVAVEEIPFWNEILGEDGLVSFEDWLRVDAWYRSRCLELPRSGEAMVPGLDLANHSTTPNAYYEETSKDEIILVLHEGSRVLGGGEITISYGDKSAAEFLFSYGFIDTNPSVDSVSLPLDPLPDDPLAKAKMLTFTAPPIVEISRSERGIRWESSFAHFAVLNEEDGLEFRILQEIGGNRQLKVFWQSTDVTTQIESIETLIQGHPHAQIFRLRAVTVVADRIRVQLDQMRSGFSVQELDQLAEDRSADLPCRIACARAAAVLRGLEQDLLNAALYALGEEQAILVADESVVAYLGSMETARNEQVPADAANEDEDEFS